MKKYFIFNNDIILIEGKERGLIHNLNNGTAFSIDKYSKEYLSMIISGKTINEVIGENKDFIQYLDMLVNKKIGYYSDYFVKSGVINYKKNVDKSVKTVWFELRKACNLNCCHCYLDSNSNCDNDLKLLSLEEWKKVIDELEGHSPLKVILIGGEPLLYKGIEELIDYCREKFNKSEIVLYSNITLLTDKIEKCIIKNKIKVVTSVYSHDEGTHDKITNKKGSFNSTVRNIKRLIEKGVYVQANTVIMTYNVNDIDKTLLFVKELTENRGKIDYIRNVGKSKEHLLIKNEKTKKFNLVKKDEFIRNYSGNTCYQGKINITCDGYVSPCIMSNKYIDYRYNIRNYSISDIIENYIYPTFWCLSKDAIDECKECEYRYICKDCRAKANKIFSKQDDCPLL